MVSVLVSHLIWRCACSCGCASSNKLFFFGGVLALLVAKRFLTNVRMHVTLQSFGVTGRVAALLTCKGLFFNVCELMTLEIFSLCAGAGGNQLVWTNSCAVCKQKVFLNGSACVSWGYQLLRRSSRTLCKQKDSLHCEPACVFSDEQHWYLSSCTCCNCVGSLHHAEACAFLGLLPFWRRDYTKHRY